jgi:hypothetical protein
MKSHHHHRQLTCMMKRNGNGNATYIKCPRNVVGKIIVPVAQRTLRLTMLPFSLVKNAAFHVPFFPTQSKSKLKVSIIVEKRETDRREFRPTAGLHGRTEDRSTFSHSSFVRDPRVRRHDQSKTLSQVMVQGHHWVIAGVSRNEPMEEEGKEAVFGGKTARLPLARVERFVSNIQSVADSMP